jgi:hypothetical protein
MPELPENATPSRTCPDRHRQCPLASKGERCKYLAAPDRQRIEIRITCLQQKEFHEALGYDLSK